MSIDVSAVCDVERRILILFKEYGLFFIVRDVNNCLEHLILSGKDIKFALLVVPSVVISGFEGVLLFIIVTFFE